MKINRIKRYFLSALTLSSGSIVLHALSVLFNVYISGKIGAEAMGLYTLTGGVYSFAITLATSGVNLAVVRLVSSALPYGSETTRNFNGAKIFGIIRQALFYTLFFSILSSVLLFSFSRFIGARLLGDLRVVPALKVMALSLVPIGISSVLNGYFCAVRRVYKNVAVQFFEQSVKITFVISMLSLFVPSGTIYACLCIAIGGVVSEFGSLTLNIILFLIDKKRNFIRGKKGEKIDNNAVFGCAFPLAVSAYLRSFLSMVEHIAIPWGLKKSGLGKGTALASYGTLHGMVFPFIFFPASVLGAFSSLLVPEIASAKEANDFGSIRKIVGYVFSFSLLFSLCVSGVFICFSGEIGLHFFGSEEAGRFIKILSPLIPLMYLDFSVDAILKGLGEHIYTMRVNILDSLLSVILIFSLVPFFGIYGYVAIIFITEIFNVSMSIIRLLNKTGVKSNIIKWIVKPTFSIIASTLLCRLIFCAPPFDTVFGLIGLGKITTGIEIFICVLLYILFSRITGAMSNDEINLAKAAVKGAR